MFDPKSEEKVQMARVNNGKKQGRVNVDNTGIFDPKKEKKVRGGRSNGEASRRERAFTVQGAVLEPKVQKDKVSHGQ